MDSRKEVAAKYEEMWGKKWFMITNPIYGRWEAQLYNNEYPDTEERTYANETQSFKAIKIKTYNLI